MRTESTVRQRQAPLTRRYRHDPQEAVIAKRARTVPQAQPDPFHATVAVDGPYPPSPWHLGIDDKVGGDHDRPNPAEMLLAALAGCYETTLRMVADNLGVAIVSLEVIARGTVDARGCLAVDDTVKIGFDAITLEVAVALADGTDPERGQLLRSLADRLCVTADTLRTGVPIDVRHAN